MKVTLFIVFIFFWLGGTSQTLTDTARVNGKVSHQFRKSGCPTLIILQSVPHLTLIPREKLPKTYDKNGLKITFKYRRLRIANPAKCLKGSPAEITNISKEK